MTTFETSQGFVNVEQYRINVTARLDNNHRQHMRVLTEKTVKLWLAVARKITAGERQFDYPHSPETSLAKDEPTANGIEIPLAEARCTVWGDLPGGNGFTVHSHTIPQDALDIYWARFDALQGFKSAEPPPQVQIPPAATETPKNPPSASNTPIVGDDGVVKVGGKKQAATLSGGTLFELPIYQIKLRSQDDSQYYEFYTKYGGNLGKFPEMRVYTDNEVAKTNGVLDFLGGYELSPGKDKMGEWVVRGVVKDKGDKKDLYVVSVRAA